MAVLSPRFADLQTPYFSASVHPLPQTLSHAGERKFSNSLFRKTSSPLVGEGWSGGGERLLFGFRHLPARRLRGGRNAGEP